jgi:SH2 domain
LYREPWFFGFVKMADAKRLLCEKTCHDRGYFLVRYNEQVPGEYLLMTVDHKKKISQYRITHQVFSSFQLITDDSDEVEGSSMKEIITLARSCSQNVLWEKDPLPGSPFASFFS